MSIESNTAEANSVFGHYTSAMMRLRELELRKQALHDEMARLQTHIESCGQMTQRLWSRYQGLNEQIINAGGDPP